MSVTGLVAGVVGVAGGLVSSNASKQAAKGQSYAAEQAAREQQAQALQTRNDQDIYRNSGAWAAGRIRDLMSPGGDLEKGFTYDQMSSDPGYQFRLDQGLKAIQRSAAARGGALSGGTLKGLTDYAQGSASQEYGNAYGRWNNNQTNTYNRLASMAGLGQTGTQATSQAGLAGATNAGNLYTDAAAARAAGTVGSNNAIQGGVNSALNTWMQYQAMNKGKGSSMWGSTANAGEKLNNNLGEY